MSGLNFNIQDLFKDDNEAQYTSLVIRKSESLGDNETRRKLIKNDELVIMCGKNVYEEYKKWQNELKGIINVRFD